jgi:hypothetical protein
MSTRPSSSENPTRSQIQIILAVALIVMSISVVGTFVVMPGFADETVKEIVNDFRALIIMEVRAALIIFGLDGTVTATSK